MRQIINFRGALSAPNSATKSLKKVNGFEIHAEMEGQNLWISKKKILELKKSMN